MRAMAEFRTATHPEQLEVELIVRVRKRRRVLLTYGTPPGSHIGIWRTDTGRVSGWNLRIGRRYVGPCLTLLAHVGPLEPIYRRDTALEETP